MDARWLIETATVKKVDDLFRLARQIPTDRLDWAPGPHSRSTLSLIQECGIAPLLHIHMLTVRSWDAEREIPIFTEYSNLGAQHTNLEQCEAVCRENTAKLMRMVREYPEELMTVSVEIPFNGGINPTMAELMLFHFWNMSYHEGQIQYILNLLPSP